MSRRDTAHHLYRFLHMCCSTSLPIVSPSHADCVLSHSNSTQLVTLLMNCWNIISSWRIGNSVAETSRPVGAVKIHSTEASIKTLTSRLSNDIPFPIPEKSSTLNFSTVTTTHANNTKKWRCDVGVWPVCSYMVKKNAKNYKFLFYIPTCKWASSVEKRV